MNIKEMKRIENLTIGTCIKPSDFEIVLNRDGLMDNYNDLYCWFEQLYDSYFIRIKDHINGTQKQAAFKEFDDVKKYIIDTYYKQSYRDKKLNDLLK